MLLYLQHAPDLSASRNRALDLSIRHWRQFGGPGNARRIETSDFVTVRAAAHQAGLSPYTVEHFLAAIVALLRHVGPQTNDCPHGLGLLKKVPYAGRKLSLHAPLKPAVALEHLGLAYRLAGQMDYAPRGYDAKTFLRSVLVIAYNTGLRFSDLFGRLRWDCLNRSEKLIALAASKTRKHQMLPVNDTLLQHLDMLPQRGERMLELPPSSAPYLRMKLRELCFILEIPEFGFQSIRRRTGREFERAHPGAGPLILGHSLPKGSAVFWLHYGDVLETLRPAAEKIPQPWLAHSVPGS